MIERLVDTWATFCLTYRKTTLLVLAAITALAVSQLPHVRFDNSIAIWFLDNDPALLNHQRLVDTFASDELIVVGLDAPDVFAPEMLERIDRVTRAIESAPHVEKAFSLTNIESVSGANDVLEIGELVEFPLDVESLAATRERALANELYVGNIVSADGTFTCIVARLPHYADQFDYKIEAVGAVRAILEGEFGDDYYLSGGPALDEQFFLMSEADSAVTLPLMLLLLVVALWMLLRSIPGVIIPLVTVVASTIWAVGWMVLAGAHINIITTMLPPLLLAVGVADSMHVLVEYRNRCRTGVSQMTALRRVYRELTAPLFLTSLTTSIGMLSLAISRVQGIREFGIFAALGVFGAFFISMTFVPVVLSYLAAPVVGPNVKPFISRRALHALHLVTLTHSRAILAVSVALIALGTYGATLVKAETSWLEMFKDSAKIKTDTRHIEQKMAGAMTLDIMVDSGRTDGIKDPAVLRELAELEQFLRSQDAVASTQSMAGYFKDLRRAFFGNDQREYKLPETREEAAQYLLLYEMDAPDGDITEFVTFDYRETRVSVRMALTSSNDAVALIQATEDYMDREFPPGMQGTVSGVTQLYANMEEYVRDSLIRSFSIALVAIFIVFCLQMRSVRLGAIAMIPNLTPLIMCLGVMGFLRINLDSMTAMVASVAIGLAVDDSIHFVTRVRARLAAGARMVDALYDATIEVGRALVYTSLVLCAGFGVMMLGSFVGMIYFGLLCMLTIVFALAADLLLLPVVLRWYDQEEDYLGIVKPALDFAADKLARLRG